MAPWRNAHLGHILIFSELRKDVIRNEREGQTKGVATPGPGAGQRARRRRACPEVVLGLSSALCSHLRTGVSPGPVPSALVPALPLPSDAAKLGKVS